MDFDLFVIGGGSAGVRCARIAAGYGARVGVAEERFWGAPASTLVASPKNSSSRLANTVPGLTTPRDSAGRS